MLSSAFSLLDYDKIKTRLLSYTVSHLGRQQVEALTPSTDVLQIKRWLTETEEALRVIASSSVPIPSLDGIHAIMQSINKGMVLGTVQITQFARFLDGMEQLRLYMVRKSDVAPVVSSYALSLVSLPDLRTEIARCVEHEEVLDGASHELARIRKQIRIVEERVRRKIEVVRQKYKAYLQEAFDVTRGGRFVLAVKREHKRMVKGSVLDESASGQTLFVEPEEVMVQHDQLSALHHEEEQEVSRILSVLTGRIEQSQRTTVRNLEIVGHYDFLFAKAKLAKAMDARSVEPSVEGHIKICRGRHPLLEREAEPLDFTIGESYQVLIITGPNTGGKTVALKTIGLLTLMAQSGLLVPVGRGTELTVFEHILVDIGDGQSMDHSLSTFSAHVIRLIEILKYAGPRSLVLLDELAAGTDPGEGIGLSIAVLEALYSLKATIVATTHFNEIKQFAEGAPGFENARMEFDAQTLQPLYRLQIGVAGQSYALIIAEKLGVSERIVQRARSLVGSQQTIVRGRPASSQSPDEVKKDASTAGSTESAALAVHGGKATDQSSYQPGDRVWIRSWKCSGIYAGPADDRGKVIVVVKKQKRIIHRKRLAPYLSREKLYPPDYDLDIVLESKEVRRTHKSMSKRHVEGLSIDESLTTKQIKRRYEKNEQ